MQYSAMHWKDSWFQIALLTGGLLVIVFGLNPLFSQSNPAPPATPRPPAPTSAPATAIGPQAGQTWTNSLGMVFKPVPGTNVLFNQYDTTVQDYRAFAQATGRQQPGGIYAIKPKDKGDGKHGLAWDVNPNLSWSNPGFDQGPTYPVVGVSWDDAIAYCKWLTQQELGGGKLGQQQMYRLPTDAEWSAAAGGGKYPWGDAWPPPAGTANYADESFAASMPGTGWPHIPGKDGYPRTSPVGSFAANRYGLYDMGGNVWQWCMDWYQASMNSDAVRAGYPAFNKDGGGHTYKVLRGGSWRNMTPAGFAVGYHEIDVPGGPNVPAGRRDRSGFRVVVVISAP